MKKRICIFITSVLILFFGAINSNAQSDTTEDYFLGMWKVMTYGLPQGDVEMIVTFEKKDGKLGGTLAAIEDTAQKIPFAKIEHKNDLITAYYTTQGYDVYFKLKIVDNDQVKGWMMDMFEIEGNRFKE